MKKPGTVQRLLFVGIAGATATLVYFNKGRLFGTDAPTTTQARDGVLETAEFTIPIPSGYHALSREELLERVKRNSPTDAIVATLKNGDRLVIGVSRMPPADSGAPRIPPTSAEFTSMPTAYAKRGNFQVISGVTLVEYSRDGLGTSCQFILGTDQGHVTQVVTPAWFLTCLHPPGHDEDCRQVATGFRRRAR